MIESSFEDASIVRGFAYLKVEPEISETMPVAGTVQFTWKDQGHGEQRGQVYLLLVSPDGKVRASKNLTDHISPYEWEDIKTDLVATDPVLALAKVGWWYQVRAESYDAELDPGGGMELYVKDLALVIAEPGPQSVEIPFGDVSVYGRSAHLKEKTALEITPATGNFRCKWKDQGSGTHTGTLTLKLMSPNGEERASFPLGEGVAPHDWEVLDVELVATNPVLALAEFGCRYNVVADVGGDIENELHLEDLVLNITGSAKLTQRKVGDIYVARGIAKLKWQSEALETTPVSGTVQYRWKDQGSGEQVGKLYLKLMSPNGAEKASFELAEGVAPHDWEDVSVNLVSTDAVLAQATAGCWYQIMMSGGAGVGKELHVENFVLGLSGPTP